MTSYDIHFTVRLSTNHVFQGISRGWRQLFLWLQDANESDHFGIGIQALVMGTDSAGRANEEEFITWWKQTKETRFVYLYTVYR